MQIRKSWKVAVLVAAGIVAPGCIPYTGNPVLDFLLTTGGLPIEKKGKLKQTLSVESTVTIGGLDGTFDMTFGPYGRFQGTAKVVKQKASKYKEKDTDAVKAMVHDMVLDAHDADITVTGATATFDMKQTPGGVQKKYKCKITFKGLFEGKKVKGTITASGDFEADDGDA
jgi:hypothetical protein